MPSLVRSFLGSTLANDGRPWLGPGACMSYDAKDDGLKSEEARLRMATYAEAHGFGPYQIAARRRPGNRSGRGLFKPGPSEAHQRQTDSSDRLRS